MTTPFKDVENALWAWLPGAVAAQGGTWPADIKVFKSHEGRGLPFAEGPEAFTEPAHMPAAWLQLRRIEATNDGPNSVLDYYVFAGGLAMRADQAAPIRDTFEALVAATRGAILGALLPGVDEIGVSELTDERLDAVTPPRTFSPVIGYVWTFTLKVGGYAHHTP